jgi:hypothetical protein
MSAKPKRDVLLSRFIDLKGIPPVPSPLQSITAFGNYPRNIINSLDLTINTRCGEDKAMQWQTSQEVHGIPWQSPFTLEVIFSQDGGQVKSKVIGS